jgi:hypothetical protein
MYNAGVVVVNLEIVGLAPGVIVMIVILGNFGQKLRFSSYTIFVHKFLHNLHSRILITLFALIFLANIFRNHNIGPSLAM